MEKLDSLEQYSRWQNKEIVGVRMKKGEDTNAIVIEVAKLLDVNVTPEQISTSHCIPVKQKIQNDEKPNLPIIARFVNRDVRNRIYTNRKATRMADLTNFSISWTEKIYMNETLQEIILASKAKF